MLLLEENGVAAAGHWSEPWAKQLPPYGAWDTVARLPFGCRPSPICVSDGVARHGSLRHGLRCWHPLLPRRNLARVHLFAATTIETFEELVETCGDRDNRCSIWYDVRSVLPIDIDGIS